MSNYANRNAKQPDVSPRRKQDFSVRDRIVAVMLVAAFLGGISLAIGAFSVSNNASIEAAKRELKITKQAQDDAYDQKIADLFAADQKRTAALDARERELDARERDLKTREDALAAGQTELSEAETALAEAKAALEQEKSDFYASQERVRNLSLELAAELTPDE